LTTDTWCLTEYVYWSTSLLDFPVIGCELYIHLYSTTHRHQHQGWNKLN